MQNEEDKFQTGKDDGAHFPNKSTRSRVPSTLQGSRCLDTEQLTALEQSFRSWAETSSRADIKRSRKRILSIFLLIRYTGARLNEVLTLDPFRDIDFERNLVCFRKSGTDRDRNLREVDIPSALSAELRALRGDSRIDTPAEPLLKIDPGHVRRKFYERAKACGFSPELGAPDAIRRSRAVELMKSNMPLPVVQQILGHATPGLAASYIAFSEEEMRETAKYFIERETRRKTSARNRFFGRIRSVRKGDIQSILELVTLGGYDVTAVITNDSVERLNLKPGSLVTAEIKAPWVVLLKGEKPPACTAENRFQGKVGRLRSGETTTELGVRLSDGTELCSLVTTEKGRLLGIRENDIVWAVFNAFSVILHVD